MKILKNIKTLVLGGLMLGGVTASYAQQDSQYTQYMYNTISINPAYAGSRGVMSIYGMYRTQWVGLDGAPKTANMSLHSPLGQSRLGMGVSFTNDHIGVMDENTLSADLSYTVDLNDDYKLSFGLKASVNLLNVEYSKLNIFHPNDVVFEENVSDKFSPNIGAGLYLRSDKNYLGFSIPNFLETDRYSDENLTMLKQKMNFYLIGGHVFDMSYDVKFKPAFMIKAVTGAPLQVDFTANFIINERIVIGGAYRWDAAVSGLAGFQVSDGLFIGYAYDYGATRLENYTSGSHELFMRFELFNRFNRITSPRFF